MWSLKRKRASSDEDLPPAKMLEQTPILHSPDAITIETEHRFFSDEVRFSQQFHLWTSHTLYVQGSMGSGKTIFLIQSIARVLCEDPTARVIYLNPYNETSMQIFSALHKTLPKGIPIAIHTDTHATPDDWRVLICHPRSLHRFDLRSCALLVVDELSAFNEQLLAWNQSEIRVRESVERAKDALSHIVVRTDRLVMCCAQITDRQVNLFNELASIKAPKPALVYRSLYKPPLTELVVIHTHDAFLAMIWEAVVSNKRIAVAVGTAASARKHDKWLRLKIALHNNTHADSILVESCSTVWSAEALRHVGKARTKDVTRYLTDQGTRCLFYTSALSPGMSIDHDFGHWAERFLHLCKNTGPSLNVVAQILNRVRKLTDHTIYCYIEPRSTQPPLDERKISSEYLRKHPSAVESIVNKQTGRLEAHLKLNHANELRLDIIRERALVSPEAILKTLQTKLDNAQVTMRPPQEYAPCPVWTSVNASANAMPDVVFLTQREVDREGLSLMANGRSGRHSGNSKDRTTLDVRRCIPTSILPVDQRFLNLHPKKAVFQHIAKAPRALEMLKLLCVTDQSEFNTSLDIRLARLKDDLDNEYIPLHDRIHTTDVCFLLTRLLLSYHDVVDSLDSSTLALVRSDLTYQHYDYLIGDFSSLDCFLRVHGPMLTSIWSQKRRLEFKEVMAGTKPCDAAFRLALFRLCCTQAGIGLNTSHSTKLRHSANNPWKAIGVNIDALVESIKTPATLIDHYALETCSICQTGEAVECLRQDGQWVCASAPSIAVAAHRNIHQPLDEVINHTDTPGDQDSLADSILEVCGFVGGTRSKLNLSKKEIEASWAAHCLLRKELLERIDSVFGLKLVNMSKKTRKAKEIVSRIAPVIGAAGASISYKKKQLKGKRAWLYSVAPVHTP